MALYPEDVRRDLLELGQPPAFAGVPFKSSSHLEVDGVPAFMYLDFDEVTPNGVMGDPRVSSPEVGKKILDHVVEIGAHFVRMFAALPTRILGDGPRTVAR